MLNEKQGMFFYSQYYLLSDSDFIYEEMPFFKAQDVKNIYLLSWGD